jgi:hypothetical protein
MLREGQLSTEKKDKTPVFIVVEDSAKYSRDHKRNLAQVGIEAILWRGIGNFEEKIAELVQKRDVVGIITDGLHGNWELVYNAAIKKGIKNIWLISGNKDMIETSKHYPYIKSISKADLHSNPKLYKNFVAGLGKNP